MKLTNFFCELVGFSCENHTKETDCLPKATIIENVEHSGLYTKACLLRLSRLSTNKRTTTNTITVSISRR